MHALWDIPELVQLIFGLVDRRTVTELARVCHLFWLQALPFIWRSVNRLEPLLHLLPEDAVPRTLDGSVCISPFTLTRALDKSDWDRFILHSQHIRHFRFRLWEQHVLLELAPHLPSTPIMQNLSFVRFEINWKLKVNLELLGHFLPPSVTNVDVDVSFQEEDGQRFLNMLATEMKLPHLRSFSVTGFRPKKDVGSSVSHVLRSYQGIERLTLAIGNSHQIHEVLRLAGQLPQLRHFVMRQYDGTVFSLDDDSFPALESLELSTASHCLDPFLVWVPSEKIIRLKVQITTRLHELQGVSGTPLADAFHTIGTFTRLRVLDVILEVVTTWETMHHILGCKELRTFVIRLRPGSDLELEESHLEQMGRAWRDLKTLRLQLLDGSSPQTKFLKLSHLCVIATEFRNLQALKINIDARAASNSQFSLSDLTVPAQYSLQDLDVELSLLDKEGEKIIGTLLASWWPNVREITYQWSCSSASHWSAVKANYRSYIS